MKVGECSEGWCEVSYGSKTGWVSASYLSTVRPTISEATARNNAAAEVPSLPYRIVEEKDYSYATTRRMSYRVVVTTKTLPAEASLRETAEVIWRSGNRGWAEFTVFLYLPGMNTGDLAYGVAEFGRGGLQEFRVQDMALWGTQWSQ